MYIGRVIHVSGHQRVKWKATEKVEYTAHCWITL